MLKKIEHIGIAVKDLTLAIETYEKLLGISCYKIEQVESEQVTTAFFEIAGVKIELLASENPNSAISKFILKRGEGLHHIAFEVENLETETKRLKAGDIQLFNSDTKNGADHKLINFIHPSKCNGVLIELCSDSTFSDVNS